MATKAHLEGNKRYLANKVDEIKLRVPKGRKAELQEIAQQSGDSLYHQGHRCLYQPSRGVIPGSFLYSLLSVMSCSCSPAGFLSLLFSAFFDKLNISLLIKMAVNCYDFFESSNASCRKWLRFSTWTTYKVSRYA